MNFILAMTEKAMSSAPLMKRPSSKQTPEEKEKRQMKRDIRRNFCLAVTAIVLALLLTGGFLLTIWLWPVHRIDTLRDTTTRVDGRVIMLENELVQLAMMVNMTSGGEVQYVERRMGTFQWEFQTNIDAPAAVSGSTYRLRDVRIGPLNFTVLELGPLSSPFLFPPTSPLTQYRVDATAFNPALEPNPVFQSNTAVGYPLTQANIDRVVISNGCYPNMGCTLNSQFNTATVALDTIRFENFLPFPGDERVRFFLNTPAALAGATFQLSEPWQFVIPSL